MKLYGLFNSPNAKLSRAPSRGTKV